MQTATATQTKTLKIDGMSGDVCVQKVTDALKGIPGVATQSVKVGCATILADQAGCDAACAGIKKAGFTATVDAKNTNDMNSNKNETTTPTQGKGAANTAPLPSSTFDAAGTGKTSGSETSKHLTNPAANPVPAAH